MPIASDSAAAVAAQADADRWMQLAAATTDALGTTWEDVAPTELALTGHDPTADLTKRVERWGHRLPDASLQNLARFGAGLAAAEAGAWSDDHPQLATRAYEDRRFLLGDRLLHWAVPFLDALGRCHHNRRSPAHTARDILLTLGDEMRPAPILVEGIEGLYLDGEDSIGAFADSGLNTIGCGVLLLRATLRSITGDTTRGRSLTAEELAEPALRQNFEMLFHTAAARWRTMASEHPGSATLWRDLANRADRTAHGLASGSFG